MYPKLSTATPPKWWELSISSEQKLFQELARGEKPWRTAHGLSSKINMKEEDVITILENYIPSGVVEARESSKSDEKLFRYWERQDGNMATKTEPDSIVAKNQKARIDMNLKSVNNPQTSNQNGSQVVAGSSQPATQAAPTNTP